jgi:putative ABC transport system ATP-binding protein
MYRLTDVKYKDILHVENLEILPQKITCILGESGGGKTTLIKLLNRMISHDSGEILYNGKPIDDMDPIDLRREAIMLPQSPAIFPGNIRENLLIGLKFSKKNIVNDESLLETLKKIHLNKTLDENAENLSGGEKQRLALGRIILMNPKVLLLDEPSASLDKKTEKNIIREVVNYIKTNNKTLVIVTHSKEIAEEYAEEIIEISQGKIIKKKAVTTDE